MIKRIVFDAYAIMAFLENEPGAQIVADLLTDSQIEILISAINLGEVYYILSRERSQTEAEKIIDYIFMEDKIKIVDAKWSMVKKAAKIKSAGGISYADAFALALAREDKAMLVTGDPEIKAVAANVSVELIWLS